MGCNCGKNKRLNRRGVAVEEPRVHIDPTRAVFAAARPPAYVVVSHSGQLTGKRFSTLVAAQDYARRTGGIIRES